MPVFNFEKQAPTKKARPKQRVFDFDAEVKAPAPVEPTRTPERPEVPVLTSRALPTQEIAAPQVRPLPGAVIRKPRTSRLPGAVIRTPRYYGGAISEPDTGEVGQFFRRVKERSGITQPGILSKVAGALWYPFALTGELVDIPFREIHDYGPYEGGVSPGDVAEIVPLLAVSGQGGGGILSRARAIQSQQALASGPARKIFRDVSKAVSRGESGFVTGPASQKLRKLGVAKEDIIRKIVPMVAKEEVTLAPVGRSKIPTTAKVDEALNSVLNKISVGDKPARNIPSPSDIYRNYVDELNPLKKLLDETASSAELAKTVNPYEVFRLLPGSWGKVDSFLSYKRFNMTTLRFEGKSLTDIINPVRGDITKFRAYYASRQVVDLEKAGIKTGFDVTKAKTVVKAFDKNFKKTADELVGYNNSVLRTLLDSGIVSRQEYLRMVKFHKRYAPMWRMVPDQDVVFSRTAKEAMRQRLQGREGTKPLRRLKGSPADIADPLESVIRNTYLYIRAADRNMAMRSLTDFAKQNENFGKLFRRVKRVDEAPIVVSDSKLAKALERQNISPSTLRALSPSGFNPKPNTIAVWENGQRIMYETHPDIVRVVKAMDKAEVSSIVRMLSVPSRLLRAGATLSPEFIARNPIRDQLSAFIFSKYGYIPVVDFMRGIGHVMKRDKLYWQWKLSGGEHSMLVSLDRVALQKDLTRALQKYGGLETELLRGWNIVNPVEALRLLSVAAEKGTRLGEFAKAVKKVGDTKTALQKAAFASREVSLDFARMGAKSRAINMMIAFWNAQVQGLDKLGRRFKEAPGATTARIAASVTLPSVILAAVNAQDGRWDEIPTWQKDLFWIVPTGFVSKDEWKRMSAGQKAKFNKDNTIYRIPKPFELGVVFGSGPERLVEYIINQDPSVGPEFVRNLAQATSPGYLPTAALPIVEIWANKSFHTGATLVPRGQQQILSAHQQKFGTTDAAKELSKLIATISGDETAPSPIHVDHLVRSWTGGLGYYALTAADSLLQLAGVTPRIPEPTPRNLEKWPLVRAFVLKYPTGGMPAIRRVFNEYEYLSKMAATGKLQVAQQKRKGYEYLATTEGLDYLRQRRTSIVNALQFAEYVRQHPTMQEDEKRRLIDSSLFGAITIAKDALKLKTLQRHLSRERGKKIFNFEEE